MSFTSNKILLSSNQGDGLTWYPSTLPASLFLSASLTYGAGRFLIGSSGSVYYSDNGIDWTRNLIAGGFTIASVLYGEGIFFATRSPSTTTIYRSFDATGWTTLSVPNTQVYSNTLYGGGRFLLFGTGGGGVYSDDGFNWTNLAGIPIVSDIRATVYNQNRFIVFNYNSAISAYSSDGVSWTNNALPVIGNWISAAYGNGITLAITTNSDIVISSNNGINWNLSRLPFVANWSDIAYGDGIFIAIASGLDIAAYSTNGITWNLMNLPYSRQWNSIAYSDISKRFVAVAASTADAAYTL
jgi:hypothetical protein